MPPCSKDSGIKEGKIKSNISKLITMHTPNRADLSSEGSRDM